MDFSLLFIIEHYIIVVQTVRQTNVGLCTNMGCPESRVRMTYVKGAAEIKKYSQSLQEVQVGQGNLSVPGDKNQKVEFVWSTTRDRADRFTWKEKKHQIWFVWSKYMSWQQRRDKFDVQRTNLLFCQGITLSTRHDRGEGARFVACWWTHSPENSCLLSRHIEPFFTVFCWLRPPTWCRA